MKRLLALLLLCLVGCEPRGPLPGGSLAGEAVGEPVADWSFAAGHYGLEVETLDDAWLPSAASWFFVHDGALYLHGYVPEGLSIPWVERVRAGSTRVRLRIDGKLYDGDLAILEEPAEIEPLLPAALGKYHMVETPRARIVRSSTRYPGTQLRPWYFRFDSRPQERAP